MGCTASRRPFVVNSKVEGQDQAALNVLTELGLSQRDIDLLYTAFWDMDADSSGTIQPIELFAYFEVESATFEKGVFCLFDEDRSGIINFMEFVCALWNILTMDESNMGSLAFMIADPTASKLLSYTDIKDLFESMHKKKLEKDPGLQDMMIYLKRDLNRAISIKDFTEWTTKHTSVLSPLRMLQTHLRFQIIGPNFWSKMTEQRRAHPEMGKIDYLPRLQARVIKETRIFLNGGLHNAEEMKRLRRRGKGPEGDTRDNVTRKQSVLVKFFGLSRFSLYKPSQAKVAPELRKRHHEASSADSKRALEDAPEEEPAAKPRRRRSSFLMRRPALLIKAEMPVEVQKKATGKKKKREAYEAAAAA